MSDNNATSASSEPSPKLGPAFQFTVPKGIRGRYRRSAGVSYSTLSSASMGSVGSSVSALSLAAANRSLSLLRCPKTSKSPHKRVQVSSPLSSMNPIRARNFSHTVPTTSTPPVWNRGQIIAVTTRVPFSAARVNKQQKSFPPSKQFNLPPGKSFLSPSLQSSCSKSDQPSLQLLTVLSQASESKPHHTTNSYAMGRYISSRRAFELSSSPPKPSSVHSRESSSKKRAQRLKIRLRLAYYKVLTNQTNLPLTRLPSPESPTSAETLPNDFTPLKYSENSFLYPPTTPSLLQQSQTTPHVFARPYIPSLRNTSTPANSNQLGSINKLAYTLQNPPSSTASTISIKTSSSCSVTSYNDSVSSLMTPVKQQHYPFHLGGYDIDDPYASVPSPDLFGSAERVLPETPAGLLKKKGSMRVAKSLLQLGTFP